MDNSEKIKAQIRKYLKKAEFRYMFIKKENCFLFRAKTDSTLKVFNIFVFLCDDHALVIGEIPIRVPENCKPEVLEYLELANKKMGDENFMFDRDVGGIFYVVPVNCTGENTLSEEIEIHNGINSTIINTQKYADGFLKVIFGKMPPIEAIEDAENKVYVI